MGLRDRLSKVFGNRPPADMAAAEEAAGMTPESPFSPGQPIGPYDGFSRQPRSHDFVTGYNIAARPKSHERVSFSTLRGMVEAYDVAQMCIWHRIDSIRALEWSLVPARGFRGDADAAIDQGMAVLEKPDRQTPFANWLAKWLYDVLAFDAGTLYRLRNRGGRVIGLRPVDGTTIAPLLDYWGNIPEAPTEGYVQYVNGLPWNWLTRDDLVYEPFRPRTNSPYGVAPLETILLNANTDLRFQQYFLQRFTEGNIPEAFASAPETWTPDQIEEFQGYWDQLLLGDQAAKHQIKWIPGGSTIAWSNEKNFDDGFSLFLMRKTCAAYHIVPADLGFTENVNRSAGETQADVQHRVGDLPLIAYIQGVLTHFLRHDLGLPIQFLFDTGQEKEDRLQMAQAWQIYIQSGMASPDEGREQLLGLPGDPQRPTPRFFSTPRLGPVPLLSIEGVGGKIDPETFGPAGDQPALPQPVVPAPGVLPAPGTAEAAASDQAAEAYQDTARETAAVAKEAAATAGITTATGITSYDLVGQDDDEEETPAEEQVQAAKAERVAFRRFAKARRRSGAWRDFEFRHVDPRTARRLNQAGHVTLRKDAGEIAVAGLAVRASDTGRVLMLQRALDPTDPAAGMWEFPGGHLEGDERPFTAAAREWSEETGMILPFLPEFVAAHAFGNGPSWTNGIYQGFVYEIPSEATLDIGEREAVSNPDDPDGDLVEAIAWWDPAQLPGNPAVRRELLDSLGGVLRVVAPCACCKGLGEHSNGCECMHCDASGTAIGGSGPVPCAGALDGFVDVSVTPDGVYEATCPCGTPAVYDDLDGWQHADGSTGHEDDLESVVEKMWAVTWALPAGQTYSSHAFRFSGLFGKNPCWYCGTGRRDPKHEAFEPDLLKAARPKGEGADGESAGRWPGWQMDLTAVAYWAPRIAAAFRGALTPRQIVDLWLALKPSSPAARKADRIRDLNGQARSWLEHNVPGLATALKDTLGSVYLDGYVIGVLAAEALVAAAAAVVDWGGWTPGDANAARLLLGRSGTGDGLESLLNDSGVTIRSVAAGRLDAVGRVLAEGVENGDSPATIAEAIEGELTDPSRAEMIATTELARAMSAASLGTYLANGIEAVEWISAGDGRVCNPCQINVEAGPRRPGSFFPSGESAPPGHPWCRCALVPVTGGT
jgi:SPP1 gp7 family putative phage head morphogenesis protein